MQLLHQLKAHSLRQEIAEGIWSQLELIKLVKGRLVHSRLVNCILVRFEGLRLQHKYAVGSQASANSNTTNTLQLIGADCSNQSNVLLYPFPILQHTTMDASMGTRVSLLMIQVLLWLAGASLTLAAPCC
jgi:hypothetical protein